tara:strand:+ start:167 stop:325 length:159 start_codon:yes stop_codon:yes gene_type:complete
MKTKLLTIFAALALCLVNFIACAPTESQNTEEPSPEADPEEEADAGLGDDAE